MTSRLFVLIYFGLFMASVADGADTVYVAQDGVVVFEVESHPPVSGWEKSTEHAGYTGSCYYKSTGGGRLTWRIMLIEAGQYQLHLRNRHEHADSTLENDCFTQMDDGESVKTYSSKRGQWTWHTRHERHSGHSDALYDLSTGMHVFTISGRSAGFMIDRIHLAKVGTKNPTDETLMPTVGYPQPPELGKLPTVERAWTSGQLGQAYILCAKVRDGEGVDQARQAIAALEAYVQETQSKCEHLKQGDPIAAVMLLQVTADQMVGSPPGTQLAATLRKWKADPTYRNLQAAQQIFDKMRDAHAKLKGKGTIEDPQFTSQNQQSISIIRSGYMRLKSRHTDTPVFQQAQKMNRDLGFAE